MASRATALHLSAANVAQSLLDVGTVEDPYNLLRRWCALSDFHTLHVLRILEDKRLAGCGAAVVTALQVPDGPREPVAGAADGAVPPAWWSGAGSGLGLQRVGREFGSTAGQRTCGACPNLIPENCSQSTSRAMGKVGEASIRPFAPCRLQSNPCRTSSESCSVRYDTCMPAALGKAR